MRRQLVRLHRWFGVAAALFLFVAGVTGATIAWDHELDAALNPSFYQARTAGPTLSSLELARRVEAADPRLQVTYLPLAVEPGHTLQMMVLPRTDRRRNSPTRSTSTRSPSIPSPPGSRDANGAPCRSRGST